MSIGQRLDDEFGRLQGEIDAAKQDAAAGYDLLQSQITNLASTAATYGLSIDELAERIAALEAAPTPEPQPEPEPEPEPPPPPPSFRGIQAEYDAMDSANTVLVVPPGVYTEELRLDRGGVEVLGMDGAVVRGRIHMAADSAKLRNFDVHEAGSRSPDHSGTVWSKGPSNISVLGVKVSGAEWAGVAIEAGSGHLLSGVEAFDNGVLGIRLESCRDTTVTSSTMRNNNTRGLNAGWEAGGMKATGNYRGISGITVESCDAFGNNGPGIWFDIDVSNTIIRNNQCHHNTRAGIIYELAESGVIHNNALYENGYGFADWGFGAGILLQNARNCRVYNNVVAWNADGIIIMSQNRGSARWNDVTNNRLENNVVAHIDSGGWNAFASAVLQDWAGNATSSNSGNRETGGRYFYGKTINGTFVDNSAKNELRHRSLPGDRTVIGKAALDAILADAGIPTEPERA